MECSENGGKEGKGMDAQEESGKEGKRGEKALMIAECSESSGEGRRWLRAEL